MPIKMLFQHQSLYQVIFCWGQNIFWRGNFSSPRYSGLRPSLISSKYLTYYSITLLYSVLAEHTVLLMNEGLGWFV